MVTPLQRVTNECPLNNTTICCCGQVSMDVYLTVTARAMYCTVGLELNTYRSQPLQGKHYNTKAVLKRLISTEEYQLVLMTATTAGSSRDGNRPLCESANYGFYLPRKLVLFITLWYTSHLYFNSKFYSYCDSPVMEGKSGDLEIKYVESKPTWAQTRVRKASQATQRW
jgi:hypothetical protein